MSKKAVITNKPPVEVDATSRPDTLGGPTLVPAAAPAVVADPPVTAGGVPVLAAENITPVIEVPAGTPAELLPDALAGAVPGRVEALDPQPRVTPEPAEHGATYEERLAEKIRAGLTREQAVTVLQNQALHDSGLE